MGIFVNKKGTPATCGHPATGSPNVVVNGVGCTRSFKDTAGGLILGGNPRVLVNGFPISTDGDPVAGHGEPPHSSPRTTIGSRNVLTNT